MISHGVYQSDSRTPTFTLSAQHDSTVPATSIPPNLAVYSWSTNNTEYTRPHANSLSSVNLSTTTSSGPGAADPRHHFQGSSISSFPYRNSFTPVPAAQGQHPTFHPVEAQPENTFTA